MKALSLSRRRRPVNVENSTGNDSNIGIVPITTNQNVIKSIKIETGGINGAMFSIRRTLYNICFTVLCAFAFVCCGAYFVHHKDNQNRIIKIDADLSKNGVQILRESSKTLSSKLRQKEITNTGASVVYIANEEHATSTRKREEDPERNSSPDHLRFKIKTTEDILFYSPPSSSSSLACSYRSLGDLTARERYPSTDMDRHMVPPPPDTPSTYLALTCCNTTAGPLSILAHSSWARYGAIRFLTMVRDGYFNTHNQNDTQTKSNAVSTGEVEEEQINRHGVALFRCLTNFLCQFGLASNPKLNKNYKRMPDDPQWLPPGPKHRMNDEKIKRFAKGYLAYAGAGENSRSNQFIVALANNGPLGGGSPWEVPWGEVVGRESFRTLDAIYTGYGEKGPTQARLQKEGSSLKIEEDFPQMDYITSCQILDVSYGDEPLQRN